MTDHIRDDDDHVLDEETKKNLKKDIEATDEELKYLGKLLKIQREKMHLPRGNRSQPSIVIDEFLYHGDLGHAIDLELLLDLHIQHIVNLCDCSLDEQIQQVFNVLWISELEDHHRGNIRQYFDQTNQFLNECQEKNEKVLVLCHAGISRSSSVVLAYLIRFHHLTLERAFEHLLERRPIANPNLDFLIQLIRYEKEIQKQNISEHSSTTQTQNSIQ